MSRVFSKCLTRVVNLASNAMPDCSPFNQIRKLLLATLGARFGAGSVIFGGGYVNQGFLSVGGNVFINKECYFDLSSDVHIDSDVTIGHGVTFITAGHEFGPSEHRAGAVIRGSIRVGRGAWVGANATILPNVSIGKGAVVGAGALVTKNVADDTVVVGCPARFIRDLE